MLGNWPLLIDFLGLSVGLSGIVLNRLRAYMADQNYFVSFFQLTICVKNLQIGNPSRLRFWACTAQTKEYYIISENIYADGF